MGAKQGGNCGWRMGFMVYRWSGHLFLELEPCFEVGPALDRRVRDKEQGLDAVPQRLVQRAKCHSGAK
jgi:hypothetical protein